MSEYEIKNGNVRALIDTDDGMTVLSLSYKGKDVIFLDEEKRKAGKTYGIPILFPTPNRTRDNKYSFNGREIPSVMHGFLKHESFIVLDSSEDFIQGVVYFDGANELFPYRGSFNLTLSIREDALVYDIDIINDSDEAFGYGIALHPFFKKDEGCTISINNKTKMIATPELLPTGETVPSAECGEDLSGAKDVNEITADTVYICDGAIKAECDYQGYKLSIEASGSFNHVVLFTAPEKPFYCIEPQSCSTDCFNLASMGYSKEAHVLSTEAGEGSSYRIAFSFSD